MGQAISSCFTDEDQEDMHREPGTGLALLSPASAENGREAARAASERRIRPAGLSDAHEPAAQENSRGNPGPIRLAIVSVGIIGTGRSSFINTLLNSSDACRVSGGQLRGTRGCDLVVGAQSNPLQDSPDAVLDFIDSEGLRSDQVVKPAELQALLEALAPSVAAFPGGTASHILFSLDVEDRQNSPTVANLLALVELFRGARANCFLCLTKWNSNSVQAEWNRRLLRWFRAHRKATSARDIAEPPPSPEEMLEDYEAYLATKLTDPAEAGALHKMRLLLEFFQGRVIWAYNLDNMQQEDRADGELAPHEEFLFRHYRSAALEALATVASATAPIEAVPVQALAVVRERDALAELAARTVATAQRELDVLGNA